MEQQLRSSALKRQTAGRPAQHPCKHVYFGGTIKEEEEEGGTGGGSSSSSSSSSSDNQSPETAEAQTGKGREAGAQMGVMAGHGGGCDGASSNGIDDAAGTSTAGSKHSSGEAKTKSLQRSLTKDDRCSDMGHGAASPGIEHECERDGVRVGVHHNGTGLRPSANQQTCISCTSVKGMHPWASEHEEDEDEEEGKESLQFEGEEEDGEGGDAQQLEAEEMDRMDEEVVEEAFRQVGGMVPAGCVLRSFRTFHDKLYSWSWSCSTV